MHHLSRRKHKACEGIETHTAQHQALPLGILVAESIKPVKALKRVENLPPRQAIFRLLVAESIKPVKALKLFELVGCAQREN